MAIGLLCLLGVIALWSVVPTLVKLVLPVFDPFTIAALRLLQGGAAVLALHMARGHRLKDLRLSRWHVLGGAGIALNYANYALALTYTTASAGALIVQVQYVTLALLAAVVLRERLGLGKIAGIALVLIGVAVVAGVRDDLAVLVAPRYALGNLLMLSSGVGWGIYALANKALAPQARSSAILVPMLGIGAAITGLLAVVYFRLGQTPTLGTWAAVVALGPLATGGAYVFVSEALKRLSAAAVGTGTALAPIGQIAVAHWILAEPFTDSLAGGGALVLGGVLAMVYAERAGTRPVSVRPSAE